MRPVSISCCRVARISVAELLRRLGAAGVDGLMILILRHSIG